MYTALVLDKESRSRLINRFVHLIPKEWSVVAHHMTINLGSIKHGPANQELLGEEAELTVVSVAADDFVLAVGVVSSVPSNNSQPHITVAVNRSAGGKPVMSNKLKNWEPLTDPFDLYGVVQEVE